MSIPAIDRLQESLNATGVLSDAYKAKIVAMVYTAVEEAYTRGRETAKLRPDEPCLIAVGKSGVVYELSNVQSKKTGYRADYKVLRTSLGALTTYGDKAFRGGFFPLDDYTFVGIK